MTVIRLFSTVALAIGVAGCASNPASVPNSTIPAPQASVPKTDTSGLPDRVAAAPDKVSSPTAIQPTAPQSIDLGAYGTAPVQTVAYAPQTINTGPYDRVVAQPSYTASQPTYTLQSPGYTQAARPLRRGEMAPVRDDPYGNSAPAAQTRASTYNIAALKAAYQPSEALNVPSAPPRVRNVPSPAFGQQLSKSALSRLNPNIAYVATYKKIGYPWGDVSPNTGVCTDVVIRSYRGLGIDLQSMVHEDMRRAFSAYPSKRIYGLRKADPNIDHRRVVNLEAFFERVGAAIPVGSDYQPGDLITWRLSGGEPHIGVVVDQRDIKTGNRMIVHNLGAGVQVEDLLEYAPPHGAYRFAPDQQSRMASLALKRG